MKNSGFKIKNCSGGFTLLEVLVALAILGIAITVVLQLFSANLRSVAASGDYLSAAVKAEAKMREILDDNALSEKSLSETTKDGYRIDVSVADTLKEKTDSIQVALLDVSVTIHWTNGARERSLTLRTAKVVNKQI